MADNPHPFTGHFLQGRLRQELELRELDVLEQLVDRTAVLQNEIKILRNGKPSEHVTILIEGLAIQSKCDSERRSHIVGFHVPGDFVDLEAFILNRLDHDSVACGQVKVGFVPHERLRKVIRDEPHLAQLLWLSTVLNASINRQWIMLSDQIRNGLHDQKMFLSMAIFWIEITVLVDDWKPLETTLIRDHATPVPIPQNY